MLNITDLMQFSSISRGEGAFLSSGTLSSRFLSHENEANITNEDTILLLFHLDRVSANICWSCQASSSLNSHRLAFFWFRQERFYDYSASYFTIRSNGRDRSYDRRYRYLSETSSLPNVLTLSHVRY